LFSILQELPDRISSDEERELLALLCRVHELEADKVSLQAERMARQAELRRRDLQLLRAERQRRLCEDIISTQRRIIEGLNLIIFYDKFWLMVISNRWKSRNF
jgi:hypothetical protein